MPEVLFASDGRAVLSMTYERRGDCTQGFSHPCERAVLEMTPLSTDEAKTGQSRARQGAGPKVAATQSNLMVP